MEAAQLMRRFVVKEKPVAIITKIEQQKNNATRYSIYLDGTYAVSLSDMDLITSGLRRGDEVTTERLAELSQQSIAGKAYDRAIGYLSLRRRSAKEVSDYLRGKEYETSVVEPIITRLTEQGYINDAEFVTAWIADRKNLKPRSRRMLVQELRTKGIDSDVIEAAFEEYGEEDEEAMIRKMAEKKLTQGRYRDQSVLTRYLVSQGFQYSLVKQIVAEYLA